MPKCLFEGIHIDYSLPTIAESLGVATRTPTAGYGQHTKFMPHFGGVLDLPHTALKNISLSSGIPLSSRPQCDKVIYQEGNRRCPPRPDLIPQECLIMTRLIPPQIPGGYSTIRAIGRDLYFDSISRTSDVEDEVPKSNGTTYCNLRYAEDINGIKSASKASSDHIIVKYSRGAKILRLDASYEIDNSNEHLNSSPCETVVSISEKSSYIVKDACLNPFNKTIHGIASEVDDQHQIKLYDITHSRHHFHKIAWESDSADVSPPSLDTRLNVRTFGPLRPITDQIQQLSNIPTHLTNMLLTTNFNVWLIDPRLQSLGQSYAKKSGLPSSYPIEQFRRVEFSTRSDYQFYHVTNVFLRVFDTRYPGIPVNQVNHMLDTMSYNNITMEVVSLDALDIDTICIATPESVGFISFQDGASTVINPKSVHQPIHIDNPRKAEQDVECLFGMAIDLGESDSLFTLLQMTCEGDLSMRKFKAKSKEDEITQEESEAREILSEMSLEDTCIPDQRVTSESAIDERIYPLVFSEDHNEEGFLDIFNTESFLGLEEEMESIRAQERYNKMKERLNAA